MFLQKMWVKKMYLVHNFSPIRVVIVPSEEGFLAELKLCFKCVRQVDGRVMMCELSWMPTDRLAG